MGGQADAEVDRVLDAGMARVHDLVTARLGEDPALRRLQAEIESEGQPPDTWTVRRAELAVAEAVERDPAFAERLRESLAEVDKARRAAGEPAFQVFGNVEFHADGGSLAAGVITGPVTLGNPPRPETDGR
ncbi:hypothetical protein AB0F30_36215 [Streptomyces sp. NPDC029006]|uniref:hypothetical protein n=1 Tax=Streptomyces sp. NPDC029006 TaxID=3155467 RepID=UPI0033FE8C65